MSARYMHSGLGCITPSLSIVKQLDGFLPAGFGAARFGAGATGGAASDSAGCAVLVTLAVAGGIADGVRRGFCARCGSTLFFDPLHEDWIGVSMGAFDGPTGTKLAVHIFVADRGDYYDIADGRPQQAQP